MNERCFLSRKRKLPSFPRLLKKDDNHDATLGIVTKDREMQNILTQTLNRAKKDCQVICSNSRMLPMLTRGTLIPMN